MFFLDFIEKISELTGRIFAILLGMLEILVVSEVVMRYVFNNPSVWSFPVIKMLFGANFMLAMAYTLLHKSHVVVDIIYSHLDFKVQKILDLLSYSIFFFPFVGIVIFHGYHYAFRSLANGETTFDACLIPLYPIKIVIPIAFLLLFSQGLVVFLKTAIQLRNKRGIS